MMLVVKKGETGWRNMDDDYILAPDEVAQTGPVDTSITGPRNVWDDKLQQVRPKTAQEIAATDVQKQKDADRAARIAKFAASVIDAQDAGHPDPVAVALDAVKVAAK